MVATVDLDALSVKYFPVRKLIDGVPTEFRLNDRVSTGVTIWAPSIAPLLVRLEELRTSGSARDLRETQIDLEERVLYFCAEIFRNAYPETTDDWVREHFSHDDRWEICTLFFTSHGADSANASPDGGQGGTEPKKKLARPAPTSPHSAQGLTVVGKTRRPEEEILAGMVD
jgi:hypothetical protein